MSPNNRPNRIGSFFLKSSVSFIRSVIACYRNTTDSFNFVREKMVLKFFSIPSIRRVDQGADLTLLSYVTWEVIFPKARSGIQVSFLALMFSPLPTFQYKPLSRISLLLRRERQIYDELDPGGLPLHWYA